MRIKAVKLENFRGYENETKIELTDLNVIVGKNDIGKSTVLEALDIFFNENKGVIKIDKDDINKTCKENGNAEELAKIVIDMMLPYKKFVHSITSDNGKEFAEHKNISEKLLTEFFFAHPYSSWERGLSEYTNKLVRQYIPKKSIFNQYNEKQIMEIQYKINRRPRKKLDYDSPKNIFYKFVNNKVALAS